MTGRTTCAIILMMFAIGLINAQAYNVTVGPDSKTRQAVPIDIGPCDAMLNIRPESPWKLGSSHITTLGDDNLWAPGPKGTSEHTYNMVNAYSSQEYVHIHGTLTQNGGKKPPPPFDVTVPAVDIDWVGCDDKAKTHEGASGQEVEFYNKVACQITTNHNEMREFIVRPPFDDYSMFQNEATLKLLFNGNLIYVYDKFDNPVSGGQELTFLDSASERTYHMSPKNNATAGQEFFITVEGAAGGDGYKPRDAIRGIVLKVDIDKIAFNYKPTTATDEALNIRENFKTPISVPEYVKGGQNKPAAYIKDKAVKVLVRLKVEPNTITSLRIKGVSDDTNGSLGNATEKTVTFSGGVSQEGVDDVSTTGFDESEYVEFTINGNTPNKVFKSEEAWKWIVTEINGTAVSDIEVDWTSGHKVFVLWDTPKSPWNQISTDTGNPWVNALEFAVVTCNAGGKATEDLAMSAITTHLYTISYDGLTQCLTPSGKFSYTDYMTTTLANCLDSAVGLDSTGSLLGMDLFARRRTEFFGFNFHCFVKKDSNVYDSCSAMNSCIIKMDYDTYKADGTPGAGTVESDETYTLE